jgi:hypothetical protein
MGGQAVNIIVQKWDAESIETALVMWEQGLSSTVIADHLGRAKGSICGLMDRLRQKGEKRAAKRKHGASSSEIRARMRLKPRSFIPEPVRPRPAVVRALSGIEAEAFDLASQHVTLMQLTATSCRYPVDGEGAHTLFCGEPARFDSSYCKEHHARCTYTPKEGLARYFKRITGQNSRNGAFS